jgi:Ca2+-binding EF-hand superfamily protein
MPPPDIRRDVMTKMRNAMTVLALATLTGAAMSTAALADRMGGGMGAGGPLAGLDFAAADADKDGKLTAEEMEAYRAAEVTAADADKDGKLSAAELAAMTMARMQARAEAQAAQMVERHDADGDGMLTVAELSVRPAPARMFERLDADGDGALSEAEIEAGRAMMAEMRGGRGEGRGHGRSGHGGWFGGHDQ